MGGVACALPRHALLRFETVPTSHKDQREFDEQIRQVYANPLVAVAVADETTHGEEVYHLLAKEQFTQADRQTLLDIVESLYED